MEAKRMNCEYAKERLTDWLNNQLSEAEQKPIDKHLTECVDCRQAFEADQQLWQLLRKVETPEPSGAMRDGFYAMLNDYKKAEASKSSNVLQRFTQRLQQLWTPQLALRAAYGVCLLSLGLFVGYWLNRPQETKMEALATEIQEMRQMMMLALIENPSASERLKAVSYTKEINEVDDRVLSALFATLNNDPNVNVRLVTLEALAELAHDPHVREGLVLSLSKQESPLVQVALADVMVRLQEKRAIKTFRQMLRREDLNDLVKSKIQQTIKDLS